MKGQGNNLIQNLKRLGRKSLFMGRWLMPQVMILLYHRVIKLRPDSQLLCVSPDHFAEHLEYLRRHYYPMSLRALKESLDRKSLPRRGVVITIDDGYADNLYNALPLLQKADIPATIFVASAKMGSAFGFWWDELETILLLNSTWSSDLELFIDKKRLTWPMYSSIERKSAYRDLYNLMKPMDEKSQENILLQIVEWGKVKRGINADYRLISSEEIKFLAQNRLIEIGSHSAAHLLLSNQTLICQRNEIFNSKSQLERIIGKPVVRFSYPYGSPSELSEPTQILVKEAGFNIACANISKAVYRNSNPFLLPRFLVRDWDGEMFARKIRSFWCQ